MPRIFNEAQSEQSREVAGQLTEPLAKRAMLQAAKGYELLARAAAERALIRPREETERVNQHRTGTSRR